MTAAIFGERFLGAREPAWHGLGKVFDPSVEPLTATQAVKRAKADFRVETRKLTIDGLPGVDTDRVAIVREPLDDDAQFRVLGYAGKGYQVLQNAELAAMLDPLTKEWPVETVGVLGYGERIFLTLDAGMTEVGKEPCKEYYLLTEGKTGGTSAIGKYVMTRVVCQNTLMIALAESGFSMAVPHRAGAGKELEFRMNLLAEMKKARMRTTEALNALVAKKVTASDVTAVLEAAYPVPTTPGKVRLLEEIGDDIEVISDQDAVKRLIATTEKFDYFKGRVDAHRDGARELYDKICDEFPAIGGTAWAIYNAVVECEDYRNGSKRVAEQAVFGSRAQTKIRAYAAASAL